jgi:vacuolar-type H+-ATPase subunit E/Vma4
MTEDAPVGIHSDFKFLDRIREEEREAVRIVASRRAETEAALASAREDAQRRLDQVRSELERERQLRMQSALDAATVRLDEERSAAEAESALLLSSGSAKVTLAVPALAERIIKLHADR